MRVLEPQKGMNDYSIGIVVSRFNENITEKLLEGAVGRLLELGFSDENIVVVRVPGAVEIPIAAQRLALTGNFAAIITLGAVIFGETKHFEYVCQIVSHGTQEVALKNNIPVIFGVLTTENMVQAENRTGGSKGHMGREAADAAYNLVSVLHQI